MYERDAAIAILLAVQPGESTEEQRHEASGIMDALLFEERWGTDEDKAKAQSYLRMESFLGWFHEERRLASIAAEEARRVEREAAEEAAQIAAVKAKVDGMAAVIAWTRRHGVTPLIRESSQETVTGERLSDDERGHRSTGYRSVSVSAVGPDDETIARWPVGRASFDEHRADATPPVIAACWAVIESGPMPATEEVTVLADPSDYQPAPNRGEGVRIENMYRMSIVLVRGPAGRYVEARYTFPFDRSGGPRKDIHEFKERVTRDSFSPSKKNPGTWLVTSDRGRKVLGRITTETKDAVCAAFIVSAT
jgi:hypothetical protein